MTLTPERLTEHPNRHAVLDALRRHEHTHPYPPTLRALSDVTGLCLKTVHKHVRDLRDDGLVAFEDGQARTLRSSTVTDVCRRLDEWANAGLGPARDIRARP